VLALLLVVKAHRKHAAVAAPMPAAAAPVIDVPPKMVEPDPAAGNAAASPPADDGESVAGTPNWVHESLREARQCLVAKRYACTIERAEEVLKSVPAHPVALRLERLGREGLQGAPAGGRKKL